MVRIAIVEDEKACRESLKDNLLRFCKEESEQFDLHFFDNGLDFLDDYKIGYDIVFMDIKMPHLDGMETAKKLREIDSNVCIIFVTNMANYAIKGYEVEAMYFLLKPIQYFNFSKKLEKAISVSKKKAATVTIKTAAGFNVLDISDIYYLEVIKGTVIYHTANGDYREQNTLKNAEIPLLGYNFARCNKCYLVNYAHVTGIKNNTVTVRRDDLLISRPRKKEFLDGFTKYLGRK